MRTVHVSIADDQDQAIKQIVAETGASRASVLRRLAHAGLSAGSSPATTTPPLPGLTPVTLADGPRDEGFDDGILTLLRRVMAFSRERLGHCGIRSPEANSRPESGPLGLLLDDHTYLMLDISVPLVLISLMFPIEPSAPCPKKVQPAADSVQNPTPRGV